MALFKIRNLSVSGKLIVMQMFTSVIVLVVIFFAFIISDIRDYKERKLSSMKSIAHVVGKNSVSAIEFQDDEAAAQMLMDLQSMSPEIVYAAITADGSKFASYQKQGLDTIEISQSITTDLSKNKSAFFDELLFINDDIINNGKSIGTISLAVELTELLAIKKAKFQMATILLLVAIAISFLIALMVQPIISRRILNLVHNMKEGRVSSNFNIPSISDDGKDEISTLTQTFNELMEQVKESQQKKDEFIGIASHELKTPLTSVKGYLDLLDTLEDRELNKKFVRRALESSEKLEKLIGDLLDVSKIQSGQLQLNISEFNIDSLINDSISSFQLVSTSHKIDRQDELQGQLITGDKQRIEQVLINLLSNAVKYSPGQNKITVSSYKTEEELVICIRDFGMGIAKEETGEIFERFYRTRNTSVHISGFGLGLYICKDIIRRHHGKIWVENENKGTTVCFSLPLTSERTQV